MKRQILLVFGIVLLFFSCNKFSGSQEIPAYLRIEPWTFTTDYEREGAATQAITDAWVYVDGNLQGCFELKKHDDGTYATIPLLVHGEHKLQLYPGVKLNGISSTRIQYPGYRPYVTTRTLTEGQIETVRPSTKYYSIDSTSVSFELLEDFEDANNIHLTIDTNFSHAIRQQISHRNNPNAWLDPFDTLNHYRSVKVHLGDSIYKFSLVSGEITSFPDPGNYVLLELDHKCQEDFLIGMYIFSSQNGLQDKELYYVKASDTWKKMYINFSPTISENYHANYFKFYMKGVIDTTSVADYYFDNVKLVYVVRNY